MFSQTSVSRLSKFSCLVVGSLLLSLSSARAAYTNHFDALRAELESRSSALTNTSDKAEAKIKKSIDKIIATIDKPADDLGDDLKTAAKILKSLEKTFPNELNPVLVSPAKQTISITNVFQLIDNVFDNIESDVDVTLSNLVIEVNALPDGPNKTNALDAIADAQAALDAANDALNVKEFTKAISGALKAVVNAVKAITAPEKPIKISKGFHCKVDGDDFKVVGAISSFSDGTKELTVSGGTLTRIVGIIASGITGTGEYPLDGASVQNTVGQQFGLNVTGTVNIVTFDLPNQKVAGTFSFTAKSVTTSDIVTVTEGTFSIDSILMLP